VVSQENMFPWGCCWALTLGVDVVGTLTSQHQVVMFNHLGMLSLLLLTWSHRCWSLSPLLEQTIGIAQKLFKLCRKQHLGGESYDRNGTFHIYEGGISGNLLSSGAPINTLGTGLQNM